MEALNFDFARSKDGFDWIVVDLIEDVIVGILHMQDFKVERQYSLHR